MINQNDLPNWFQSAVLGENEVKTRSDCVRELELICENLAIAPISTETLNKVSREKLMCFLNAQSQDDLEDIELYEKVNGNLPDGNFHLGSNFIAYFDDKSVFKLFVFSDGQVDNLWSSQEFEVLSHSPFFVRHHLFGNIATIDKKFSFVTIVDGDSGWDDELWDCMSDDK